MNTAYRRKFRIAQPVSVFIYKAVKSVLVCSHCGKSALKHRYRHVACVVIRPVKRFYHPFTVFIDCAGKAALIYPCGAVKKARRVIKSAEASAVGLVDKSVFTVPVTQQHTLSRVIQLVIYRIAYPCTVSAESAVFSVAADHIYTAVAVICVCVFGA